jgi:hypothetical protein
MPRKKGPAYRRNERQIDDLLEIGGIAKTPTARSDLEIALWVARSASAIEKNAQDRPSPRLLDQLERSIVRTRMLLAEVKGHASSTVNVLRTRAGADVVKAAVVRDLGKHGELPTIPEDSIVVEIDIQNLLDAWHNNIKRIPRRKRSNPGKPEKDAIVYYADQFFRSHSPVSSAKFIQFAERFFDAVLEKPTSETFKLEWPIRMLRVQKKHR